MQETGNNQNRPKKILSIRLWRGGLSFYFSSPDRPAVAFGDHLRQGQTLIGKLAKALDYLDAETDTARYDVVQLFLDTSDAVFIPKELAHGDLEAYLVRAGLAPDVNTSIVLSEPENELCAVMRFDATVVEYLKAQFGVTLHWLCPIHESLKAYSQSGRRGECIVAYPTAESVYLTGYDTENRLVLAEVYPCESEADLVYYFKELTADVQAPKRKYGGSVYLYGDRSLAYLPSLKRFFRKAYVLNGKH